MRLRESEEDEGELAALREDERRAQRDVGLEAAGGADEEGDQRLERVEAKAKPSTSGTFATARPTSIEKPVVMKKRPRGGRGTARCPPRSGTSTWSRRHAARRRRACPTARRLRELRHPQHRRQSDRREGRLVLRPRHHLVHALRFQERVHTSAAAGGRAGGRRRRRGCARGAARRRALPRSGPGGDGCAFSGVRRPVKIWRASSAGRARGAGGGGRAGGGAAAGRVPGGRGGRWRRG